MIPVNFLVIWKVWILVFQHWPDWNTIQKEISKGYVGKRSCERTFVSRGFCSVSLYFSIFWFLKPCFILVTEIQVNLKFPESFIFSQFISILSRLLKTPSLKFLLLQEERNITLRLERVIVFPTEVDLGKSEILGTDKEDFRNWHALHYRLTFGWGLNSRWPTINRLIQIIFEG